MQTLLDQLVEPFIDMCKELQTNIYIANNKHTQSKISYLNENVCSGRHSALGLHQCVALVLIYLFSLSFFNKYFLKQVSGLLFL